jgi:penicillin G amidase
MRQLRNGFILLLGVLFLSAWAQRTELRVRGETVTIIRDAYGVPHVFASSLYGLFYGNGYAIAQDRLWQMERYRRQARGELAEILGPSALEQDRAARIEGYTEEEMERQIQRLSAELREALSGYADGVNAWIEEAKRAGKLPPGYAEAGIEPRPWRPTDTVAIGVMMSRRFGGLMAAGDLRNFTLLQYLRMRSKEHAETWANDLLWLQDPNSPTTVPPEDDPRKAHKVDPKRALEQFKKHAAQLPNIGLEVLLPALRMASGEAQIEFARQHGLYTHFGSYAIAIAPKKSATGNALFVGAPQMGFSIPHIAAEVHLSGAGINAQGMSFPGIPGILIGATDHIAWSFTSGIHDLADAFIEKLNPENPEQYWYKGEWRPLEKRVEVIRVKGREPIELTVYRSIHGPIVAIDKRNNVAIAWSLSFWGKELESMNAYYGILRARTVGDFERACSHIVASFNAFCATRTGDIAYFYCGRPPIRAEGVDPRLPVWGTGEYDWKGIIPFEQMPRVINPKRGFIVNWNNKPAVWWENCDTPAWGAIFRVHRLIELASRKPVLSLDDVKAMIADIAMYDEDAAKLKPVMLAIVKRHRNLTPEMQQAIRVLEAWDNSEREGSMGKVIWDAWLDATRTRLFGDDLGNFFDPNLFRMAIQPSYILYALQGNKAAVPRLYDYFNGKPKEEVLAIALGDALTQLKQQYGANMSQWRYKAPRMNWDKLPGIPYTDRGSYIQVIELSNPIVGENILPPGQSEDPTSPHFSDQRDLSSWWLFKPMQLQLTP